MDHQRVHRVGNRTYYRSNYVQSPNHRPTIEERLHAQGISTSSNSSWTFSNSHSDIPKKKKGRLCGLFLMVAVFVVLLAVIAIGGLAFYLGAVRVDNTKQDLTFDGSLRVTYGDQYQTVLSNHSSKLYREKANRYSNMLTNVYYKSVVGPALDEVRVLKFENGSLIVHFRMNLDRRKLPNSVTAVEEVLKDILLEEISSVKPIAFRNLQVDHQNLHIKRYLGDIDVLSEDFVKGSNIYNTEATSAKTVEVKNGVIRKVPNSSKQDFKSHKQQLNKTATIPEGAIIGISEKMQNLSDTLKKRQESTTSPVPIVPEPEAPIKSADFRKEMDFINESDVEPRIPPDTEEGIEGVHSTGNLKEVSSDQINEEKVITGPMNGHARPTYDVNIGQPFFYKPTQITPNPEYASSDYDEPWRPIIPPRVEQIPKEEHQPDVYDELVIAEAPPERVAPITFSRESYEENLRISPDYEAGEKLSTLTEEIAKKYDELSKNHGTSEEYDFDVLPVTVSVQNSTSKNEFAPPALQNDNLPLGLDQIISGINVVGTTVDERTEPSGIITTEEPTTKMGMERIDVTAESSSNATVKNPFNDGEDSRSAPAFSFDLPDFPILKQFHHLDSLLKSFSSESSTEDISQFSSHANETTVTRFPVRTKPTTDASVEKVYVAVSTIAPENTSKQKTDEYKSPIVIKGEVQVLDSKNLRANTATTEPPKLITLLPVRSNVKGPLRPRPKSIDTTFENRKSKMSSEFRSGSSSFPRVLYSIPQKHHFVDDKDGKRWVYYSSSKLITTPPAPSKPEKLFIVTPEPEKPLKTTTEEMTTEPLTVVNESEAREEPITQEEVHTSSTNTSELINRIVNIMENVVISTGNSTKLILKVNQTLINSTGANGKLGGSALNDTKFIISNKAVSSHYKLNQAGVPILTKILNKAPNNYKSEKNETEMETVKETEKEPEKEPEKETEKLESTVTECDNNSMSCGNGTCLSLSLRCNQQVDCPDAEDEKNCTCADHLKSQHLNRKLCDGIVDCWDFSDEFNCEWCRGKDYLCSNSKICIKKSQICDGVNNCPLGDDERYCVTVSPNEKEANSFNYHPNGYLMVRKHGEWGKLCIDNFDAVSMRSKTGWKISDLGRSVCKALTFKDFDKVERMVSVPNDGRSIEQTETGRFYELSYNDIANVEESSSTRDSTLSFHETRCVKKEVVKVTCTELECGLRPQAMNQWSRIVGGGNANPGSWPWQAALYKEGEFQCGATLISGQWLISAGHCFYHNQDEYWVARLGTLRTTSSLPSPYEQLRQISKIILHPHYVDTGFINDISLLKMAEPVTFTDYVRPICLPKPNTKIIDGMMCTVVGWGQLFEIGRIFPDTLQEVQLPIISSTECRKRTVFLPLYKITDDMFCAGYDRGGRDACLGDSGGPLMCQESDGKWSLYGVTSNGYGCARSNRPGVYTKVSKYLNWIQSQMHLHSEDEILSQSSLKQLSVANPEDQSNKNYSAGSDNATDTLIRIISERVSNVKFNSGVHKKKDKCKGHRCPLGECLSKSRLCNGFIECSDGSDEKDCW